MKFILSMIINLSVVLNASEFNNKYIECTLFKIDSESISVRKAKTLDEFKIKATITETFFKFQDSVYKYEGKTSSNFDLYSFINTDIWLTDKMILVLDQKEFYSGKHVRYQFYQCKDRRASFYEKAQLKLESYQLNHK